MKEVTIDEKDIEMIEEHLRNWIEEVNELGKGFRGGTLTVNVNKLTKTSAVKENNVNVHSEMHYKDEKRTEFVWKENIPTSIDKLIDKEQNK